MATMRAMWLSERPSMILRYRTLAGLSIWALAMGAVLASGATAGTDANKTYEMVTGDDGDGDRSRWDKLFSANSYIYGREPAEFVRQHVGELPIGKALDIAMGEGRNAVFLAKKGFQVEGVDYSEVALRKARHLAKESRVTIRTVNADLNHYKIKTGEYDVILNINYLQRSLIPQIKKGLKPGGVVVFENWTTEQLKNPNAQSIPRDWLLEPGELKRLFSDLEVLIYTETNNGRDAVASLIARRPRRP